MRIIIQQKKALAISSELLDLSRRTRRARGRLEDVLREMRSLTELEECRRELQRQQESASVLTARLINLSTALREIAELYDAAESRNEDRTEGESWLYRRSAGGDLYTSDGGTRRQVERILRK